MAEGRGSQLIMVLLCRQSVLGRMTFNTVRQVVNFKKPRARPTKYRDFGGMLMDDFSFSVDFDQTM
jgi:hypothetical protein